MMNEIRTIDAVVAGIIHQLHAKFPKMSFAYKYDERADQHIIDVSPEDLFLSEAYMIEEANAIDSFIGHFPSENILFVCNDPYVKVENPTFSTKSLFSKLFIQSIAMVSSPGHQFTICQPLHVSDEYFENGLSSELDWYFSFAEFGKSATAVVSVKGKSVHVTGTSQQTYVAPQECDLAT